MSIKEYFNSRFVPRWMILQIDMVLCTIGLLSAFALRFNFELDRILDFHLVWVVPIYLLVRIVFFRLFRVYRGITRYTGIHDAKKLFYAIALGSVLLATISIATGLFFEETKLLPLSVILIDFFTTLVLLTSFRIGVKIVFNEFQHGDHSNKKNVIVFGAGRSGVITKRTIDQDGMSDYKVVAFFDDNKSLHGKIIEGVPIIEYSDESFADIVKKLNAKELILSIQDLAPHRKQEIIDLALQSALKIKIIPAANKWLNGELSLKQIKKVRIEDLLERDPIVIQNEIIKEELGGKVILVTGAAGSIGSELVRQLVRFYPKEIILFDQAETPLAEFKLELLEKYKYLNFRFIMGDVRNNKRLKNVFNEFKPNIVFHVAAYKHVPMMEENAPESILTNVQGTRNVADLSVDFGVEKFVMISTDKAVNPTNVMGASKRIAEIYVQSLNSKIKLNGGKTKFITTRFGNVLGSNGSVIPRFRQQLESGGPITVTHPEITRYFMTIPEACQLILEAGTMGKGGEIFIFDMGKDVKIVDLATKMIRLSGFEPDRDIKISFTGLRPGEKIREELLNNKENTMPTHHEKIMIAQVRHYEFDEVKQNIDDLIDEACGGKESGTVLKMKQIVPEFISNNSKFTQLDSLTSKS